MESQEPNNFNQMEKPQSVSDNLDFNIDISNNNDKHLQSQNSNIDSSKEQQKQQGEQQLNNDKQQNIPPPNWKAIGFAIGFKIIAIFCYLLVSLVYDSFVTVFILTLLPTCFDFWVIKNISGRLLVGLRWWNEFKDDGSQIWLYESQAPTYVPNNENSFYFWIPQIISLLFWIIIIIIKIISLSFSYAVLGIVCFILHAINFWNYYKCRGQHKKKAQEFAKKTGVKIIQNVL